MARRHEPWRPITSTTSTPRESWSTGETIGVQWHDADRCDRTQRARHRRSPECCDERVEVGIGAERFAPVHDARRGSGDIHHGVEGCSSEVDQI